MPRKPSTQRRAAFSRNLRKSPYSLRSVSCTLYTSQLPHNDIRLLTILPSRIVDSPIRCELHQYGVSSAPAYEGLSYVWGNPKNPATVTCNGLSVNVTQNLGSALRRIRRHWKPKIIWADAICLNQEDSEEKSIHVPLMGRVYSQATNTIIYLGEASHEETEAAYAGLMAIHDYMENIRKQAGATGYIDENFHQLLASKASENPTLDISWDSVEAFFGLPWFERIWCVQEILLTEKCDGYPYVLYGHRMYPYHHMKIVAWCLSISVNLVPTLARGIRFPDCISATGFGELQVPLLEVLDNFRILQATDPRDKVYGLLGVLQTNIGIDVSGFKVDYTKSISDVYVDTALEVLRLNEDLELLRHVSHPSDWIFDGLHPSWVPRWDLERRCSFLEGPFLELFSSCSARKFKGQRRRFRGTDTEVSNHKLHVSGLQYGTVIWTSSPLSQIADPDRRSTFWAAFTVWWDEIQSARSHCFDRREELLAMARTFAIGLVDFVSALPATEQKNDQFFADFLDFLHHPSKRCSHGCTGIPTDGKYIIDTSGTTCNGTRERYGKLANWGCRNRKLFRTEQESYGVGPDCMLDGDIIVAIYGTSSPFALRPAGEKYLCLGPVYIDHLMDGTFFEGLRKDEKQEMLFTLI